MKKNLLCFLGVLLVFVAISTRIQAQVISSGKIYDAAEHIVMPGVSVVILHTSQGMQSDEHGRYYLHVKPGDTLMFSFVGYNSKKLYIPAGNEFFSEDIFLLGKDLDLPEVSVKGYRSYHQDSVENRTYNSEIFNYKQKSAGNKLMSSVLSPFGVKVPFQRARHGNTLSRFQDRLMEEEEQKYVDSKFNVNLVKSITGLEDPLLNEFMKQYRPSYEFIRSVSEYDFLEQIVRDCRTFLHKE